MPLNAYAAVLEKEDINLQDYLAQYFAAWRMDFQPDARFSIAPSSRGRPLSCWMAWTKFRASVCGP